METEWLVVVLIKRIHLGVAFVEKIKDWRINTVSNCTAQIFLDVKPSGSDEAATEAVRGDARFDLFLGNSENAVEELLL